MRNSLSAITTYAITFLLIYILWKPLMWLALALIAFVVIFFVYTMYKASKIKVELDKKPHEYFNSQTTINSDEAVIDVEYTEKEVR